MIYTNIEGGVFLRKMSFCTLTSTIDFPVFCMKDLPKDEDLPTVPYAHPDVHEAFMSGEQQPKGHPSVSALVSICYVLQFLHSCRSLLKLFNL